METLILRSPVKYWPRSCSPAPRILEAGTEVKLVRKESSTLFTVTISALDECFPVLASEVTEPATA